MDNRTNTRLEFKIGLEIRVGDYQTFSVETRDLSLGGLGVASENRLPLQTECDITLHPMSGHSTIALEAAVVRHTEEGMGLVFLHPTKETLIQLCDLFMSAGRQDIIEKELRQKIMPESPKQDILMM
ncbi:MAG: c-di-GMP-binding flagellar brake protein YcgR [Candidatus Latescibacterota bacterium]|jgi:c-di-GMP-binding flagellar brake protein YcgR